MTAWHERPFLALDTETSGVDVAADRIVEVGAAVIQPDGTVGETWSAVVDAGVDIPEVASNIHGITTQRSRDEGIASAAALQTVAELLVTHRDLPVVVYNATFDLPLLLAEAARHRVEMPFVPLVVDPLVIDKEIDTYRPGSRKLIDVAGFYGVPLSAADAHGALADAIAAGRLARAIVDRNERLSNMTLTELFVWQIAAQERQRASFEAYMRDKRDPAFSKQAGWPIPGGMAD